MESIHRRYCLGLVIILNSCFWQHILALSDEKMLIKNLLKNYQDAGMIGRPVQNTSEKVVVNYGLSLIQLLDLNEKNQRLTINVWSRYTWIDQLLRWDPANYSGVSEVRIPPDKIWTPDIVLFNYADERMKEQRDVMVVVDSRGQVMWIPPAIYKSTCSIDVQNFPFDQQVCHLKFGSWTYDGYKLDIQFYDNKSEINIDDYQKSNAWDIVDRPAQRYVNFYPTGLEPYPDLTFYLVLRRNPALYFYHLVLPCVLLSSLILVIFWLPPESPAKMILGMNIFVAFFLLLLLLADSTPSASLKIPHIGYFFCLNMILITVSTFLSVIVINLYFRCDKRNPLPNWLKKFVDTSTKIFCMQANNLSDDNEKICVRRKVKKTTRAAPLSSDSPLTSSMNAGGRAPFDDIIYTRETSMFSGNNNNAFMESGSMPSRQVSTKATPPYFCSQLTGFGLNNVDLNSSNRPSNITKRTAGFNSNHSSYRSPPARPSRLMHQLSTATTTTTPGGSSPPTTPWMLMGAEEEEEEEEELVPLDHPVTPPGTPPGSPPLTPRGTAPKLNRSGNHRYNVHPDRSPLHIAGKALEPDLREIRSAIQSLMVRLGDKDRGNRTAREWRMVAVVLDRIFFWCYLLTIVISGMVLLLPKAPSTTLEDKLLEHQPKHEKVQGLPIHLFTQTG